MALSPPQVELIFSVPAGKLGVVFDDLPAGPQRQFGPFVAEVPS